MKHLMLHGLGQSGTSWTATKELLKFDVMCPNLFEFVNGTLTYDNLYSEFVRFANSFDEKLDLCGLSLGGILALNYAKDYPYRVNSIIIIGTPFVIPKFLFGVQSVLFRCMPKKAFENTGASKEDIILLTSTMRDIDIQTFASDVKCNAMVLCGKKDSSNSKYLGYFQNAIANCECKLIEGAGHDIKVYLRFIRIVKLRKKA